MRTTRTTQRNKRSTKITPETHKARKRARHLVAEKLLAIQDATKGLSHKAKYQKREQAELIKSSILAMPWLTENMIRSQAKRLMKKRKETDDTTTTILTSPGSGNTNTTATSARSIGGHPKGTTNESKKTLNERKKLARHEIERRVKQARLSTTNKQRLSPGTYNNIHDVVIEEMGLSNTGFSVSQNTTKDRIRYERADKKGNVSPAIDLEPVIVSFAMQRQEAGQPMKPSEVISFANSLIETSDKLISSIKSFFTKLNMSVPDQLIGRGWYKGFMKRNGEYMLSGKGFRVHSARRDWTTYDNIQQMYELVYSQMVDARIATNLPEESHYWTDAKGNVVDSQEKAAGQKITVQLTHPEWLLFGDKVGTDTAQVDDGHIGGQTYLSFGGRRIELESSKSSGRFTVIGLTAATGDPVMCIVIMAGNEVGVAEALGFDHRANTKYDSSKTLEENRGPGKALPGLPTCRFCGKDVPGLLCHTPKGSVTSTILQKILERLDNLNVYPRTRDGPTPMLLLDGHDSRLQVEFLSYVNKPNEFNRPIWKACISLPNGTAKWQVGDSEEQNGCWKMAMTREKDRLVQFKRRNQFPNTNFHKHDIVPLVNLAWKESFARKEKNLKAIIDRGWYYLDMRLLKDPDILKSKIEERTTGSSDGSTTVDTTNQVPSSIHRSSLVTVTSDLTTDPPKRQEAPLQGTQEAPVDLSNVPLPATQQLPCALSNVPLPATQECPNPNPSSNIQRLEELNLNFSEGIAGDFTLDMLQHVKRKEKVHEAYLKRKKEGEETQERFNEFFKNVKLTAGNIFKFNKCVLDGDILAYRQNKEDESKQQQINVLKSLVKRYNRRLEEYLTISNNGSEAFLSKEPASYTNTELKKSVAVKKLKNDGPMPQTKAKLLSLFLAVRHRPIVSLQEFLVDEGKENKELDECLSTAVEQINAEAAEAAKQNENQNNSNFEALPVPVNAIVHAVREEAV